MTVLEVDGLVDAELLAFAVALGEDVPDVVAAGLLVLTLVAVLVLEVAFRGVLVVVVVPFDDSRIIQSNTHGRCKGVYHRLRLRVVVRLERLLRYICFANS